MTNTTKEPKYFYILSYNQGNFYKAKNGIKKRYPKSFHGSVIYVNSNNYDIQLYCTARQYKNIIACARRRYGKINNVIRCTNIESKYENTK